jgi:vacuolar protein sorting-associated protein 54
MLRDAEHFKSKIGGLDGAGDAGEYIIGIVKAKSVPKPIPAVTEPPAEKPSNESITTNGKISGDLPSDIPLEMDGKGKQEEKQGGEAMEEVAT